MAEKVNVPIWQRPQNHAQVERGATLGATFGIDFKWPNGSLVKIEDFQSAPATGSGSVSWSLIASIPANIVQAAALSTAGFVRRDVGGAWTASAIVNTDLAGATTSGLPEGSNLYYTDERVRDAIGAALVAGTNITITVNDPGDTITIAASGGGGAAYVYTYVNPAFSNVVAVLPFDGTNGSTTITDYAPTNAWSAGGSAALSTADKVFGTASLLTPSGSNSCIYTNTHSGWNFGTQDFAIEFRVKKNGTPETSARIFQTRDGDFYGGISLLLNATGLELYMSSTGSSFDLLSDASAATIDVSAFNDVVLQRRGALIELFVGVKFKKSWNIGTSASLYYNSSHQIIIGGNRTGASRSINAYLDNFRVTVGAHVLTPVPEYAEPTSAFPTS